MASSAGLYYREQNPSGKGTIVLLHGLVSSSAEYVDVLKFISDKYHVLVPDLPGHTKSASIPLTSLSSVVEEVVKLIRSKARGGKAHLVGLSFGGYTTLMLAAQHPELVRTAVATGISNSPKITTFKFAPYIMTSVGWMMAVPGFNKMVAALGKYPIPDEVNNDIYGNIKSGVAHPGYKALREEYETKPVKARVMLCSGSAGDPVQGLKEMLDTVSEGNAGSVAVVASGMDHAWDIQAPELFAKLIIGWIEDPKGSLPSGVVKLEDWK